MLYMLTVVGGAGGVEDLAGNDLATKFFRHSRRLPATRRRQPWCRSAPLANSTGVAVSTPVTVTFSETQCRMVSATTLVLRDPNNNIVAATVSYNAANNTATLTPTSPLANGTLYMLTVVGGSTGVKDPAGNALATNIFSSFTTVAAALPDTTPPTVTAVTPLGASTGVATTTSVTVTFSEPGAYAAGAARFNYATRTIILWPPRSATTR